MKVQVYVTWDCIKNGERHDDEYCPIALAIRNQGHDEVLISDGRAYFRDWDGSGIDYCIHLPEKAMNFINDYSAGIPVWPFEFETNLYLARQGDVHWRKTTGIPC